MGWQDMQNITKFYMCPKCKSKIVANQCVQCEFTIQWSDHIPAFFSDSEISKRYKDIGSFYDTLYGRMDNVWCNLASRGHEFNKFISSIVMADQPNRYLDIGCGEGFLLADVIAPEKYGMDISINALLEAKCRTNAEVCVGFSEEMPYPTGYFDMITSIGVMTHFIDDLSATSEIYRVLRQGGRYVVGIFIPPTFIDRIWGKISEFFYPQPRPISLIHWVMKKRLQSIYARNQTAIIRKESQPVERHYTSKEVEGIFKIAGFSVSEMITKRKNPNAPLAGHHFRIYILRKIS